MKKRGGMNKLKVPSLVDLLTYYSSDTVKKQLYKGQAPSRNQILFLTDGTPQQSPIVDADGKGVRNLVIKFVQEYNEDDDGNLIMDNAETELAAECNQHKRIYEEALKFKVQICPSILYCGTIDKSEIKHLYETWYETKNPLLTLESKPEPAIVIMEYFEQADEGSEILQQTARFLLFLLAKIGYAHGDPHWGNYMKKPGVDEAILIDFEHATELKEKDKIEVGIIWDTKVREVNGQYVCAELNSLEKIFLKRALMYGANVDSGYEPYNWLMVDDFVLAPITLAPVSGGRRKRRTKRRRKSRSRRFRINPFN